MKFQLNGVTRAVVHVAGMSLVIGLAACGGGGGDALPQVGAAAPAPLADTPSEPTMPTPTVPVTGSTTVPTPPAPPPLPPAAPVTLTGSVVIDQAIRNAVVCMDLNANNACDAGEPMSAVTGVDGAFSLTYDPSKVTTAQVAGASLISPMVPGTTTAANTTIDAADTSKGLTAKPYVLKQAPGKAGQINPLTTLAATGIAAGMTPAVARTNSALQLGIAEAKIDNYQDDPLSSDANAPSDTARIMAKVVAATLEDAGSVRVADPSIAVTAADGDLASLTFTSTADYFFRQVKNLATAAGTLLIPLLDVRDGKIAGTPNPYLYNIAYLTANGWLKCDPGATFTSAGGSPSRTQFCGAAESVGFTVPTDVSGQTMTAVITAMQADPASNTINNGTAINGLVTALGSATFPANSSLNVRRNVNLNGPVFINSINTDGISQATATTLEQLIAARPVSGVNLATAGGTLGLGTTSGPQKNLRVAFTGTTSTTAGTVQFYECDLNAAQTVASNCIATQTGAYAISTANGVRVMRYSGNAATASTNTRAHAEVKNVPTVIGGDWVFTVRENKPGLANNSSQSKRLNVTAWAAMKAKLGL